MGYLVLANCHNCDFSQNMGLGSGRLDFRENAMWPVWCDDCGELSATNYRSKTLKCDNCGSQNVSGPHETKNCSEQGDIKYSWTGAVVRTDFNPITWFEKLRGKKPKVKEYCEKLFLTNGHYRCPVCNKMTMTFDTIGLFD